MPNEKDYCLKIQIMIDTKMMANTKKNTPFDIILQIQCDSIQAMDNKN